MRSVAPFVTLVLGLALGAVGATSRSAGWFADAGGAPQAAATTEAAVAPTSLPNPLCQDEAQLRRLIREELAAAAGNPGSLPVSRPADADSGPHAPSDAQARAELVNRRVDDYIRAGAISQVEMAALQGEIARLDPAAQRAAIGKLVRAINAGALAGNL
jgi:hypothetical protein